MDETPMPQGQISAETGKVLMPKIYCEGCGEPQPYSFSFMPADELNDHDSEDIICNACRLIIATFHAPKKNKKNP